MELKIQIEIWERPSIQGIENHSILSLKHKGMEFNWYVGIDVSKKTFDISIKSNNNDFKHCQYSNDTEGIRSFIDFLKQEKLTLEQGLVCLEHTGIYSHVLLSKLYAKGINVWLEHALSIKRSLGTQRGKNDRVDALRIAEYAWRFNDNCVLWKPAREEVNKLKTLISLRFRLIKAKKMLKAPVKEINDMKLLGYNEVLKFSKPAIEKVELQLLKVEQEIEQIIGKDNHLDRLQNIITSVDGVGKVTAWQMIVSTNEFKDFSSSRKFACYSGVVPFEHSSGTSVFSRPRVSHLANKRMKELLHMSALSATVMKGELNDYYTRKVKEGKNKMLVLNNIRNKIIQRVFTCVKENRKYEKSYTHTLV